MAEDIITTTEPTTEVPTGNRSEERIRELSGKLELTATERDEFKTLNETTTRERDFYKGFADIVSTQPNAKDHQDEIKEKVLKGYSVQDATFAVLGGLGKLGNTPAQAPQVAGGSADTSPQGGDKELKDMTQGEKRDALTKIIGWD